MKAKVELKSILIEVLPNGNDYTIMVKKQADVTYNDRFGTTTETWKKEEASNETLNHNKVDEFIEYVKSVVNSRNDDEEE